MFILIQKVNVHFHPKVGGFHGVECYILVIITKSACASKMKKKVKNKRELAIVKCKSAPINTNLTLCRKRMQNFRRCRIMSA